MVGLGVGITRLASGHHGRFAKGRFFHLRLGRKSLLAANMADPNAMPSSKPEGMCSSHEDRG